MSTPEHIIEQYFVQQVKAHGLLEFKFLSGTSGVPDRILIGNSQVVFVELKGEGKKPRKLQVYRMEQIKSHGIPVRVIDSKTGVDNLIKEILNN